MFIFRLISKSIITFAFAKIMQTSAMKACFQIAECNFSSTKKMPTSAMKACFQIAECSFSVAKIGKE